MSAIKNHRILRLSNMGINESAGEFVKHSIFYKHSFREHHTHDVRVI
jgi:hypothetical protein